MNRFATLATSLILALAGCSPGPSSTGPDEQEPDATEPDAFDPVESDAAETAGEEVPDPELDSDGDGIPDLQELHDGTDPADPSSASAWHPELTEHPRLFFDGDDVEEMTARSLEETGPWATLRERMDIDADLVPTAYPDGWYDSTVTQQWGRIAEAAAFLGLVRQDAVMTQKAIEVISTDFPDGSGVEALSNYDLREGEGLQALCTAWDYLAGNPLAGTEALKMARAQLVARIDAFRRICHEEEPYWMLILARNNHPMKVFGALGLCAMVLNQRPRAAEDLSEAMTGLDWLLNNYQSTEEGGYGEGWNYLSYGAKTFLPFLVAYHRFAGGRTLPYYGVPALQMGSPHADRVVEIPDFADNDRTREVFHRAVWSVQPDGLTPNTDDANPSALQGALLYALFDDPLFLWHWFRPAVNFQSDGVVSASFALYDGSDPPPNPGMPREGSFPEAGFAIFRDGWGPDATYLVLQGEHGTTRLAGQGHEHADELSFLLWSSGQPLIIDPGYIDWTNHDRVKHSTDHNTILVDGKGAPTEPLLEQVMGVDAFLGPMAHSGLVATVRVHTAYEDVSLSRRIARIDDRFFVVEDRMKGSGTPHTYSLLLNGMGGGDVPDSSFEMRPDGARWRNQSARIDAHVMPVAGVPTFHHDLEEHAVSHGKWALHERLVVNAFLTEPAGFLSLLVPEKDGEPTIGPALLLLKEGVAEVQWFAGDRWYDVVSNQTEATVTTSDREWVSCEPGLTIRIHAFDGQEAGALLESHHLAP